MYFMSYALMNSTVRLSSASTSASVDFISVSASMQHVLHEHTNQSSDAGVVENRLGGAGAEDAGGLQEDSGVHRGGEDAKELGGSRDRPDGAASK